MKRCAVVVGGAGHIGSKIVSEFVKRKFTVHVLDIDIDRAKDLQSKFQSNVNYHNADARNPADLQSFAHAFALKEVSIDVLVTLGGRALSEEFKGITHSSYETIRQSIELNLLSHIFVVKSLMHLMRKSTNGKSSIVVVSSINALMDFGLPAYSAAKAGLLGFVRTMATELGSDGVRINAVLPGTVLPERGDVEPKELPAYQAGSVLSRLTTAKEVAQCVGALSTLTAITGQSIVIDCGQTIKGRYEHRI